MRRNFMPEAGSPVAVFRRNGAGEWAVPEAELFAEEAMKKGVPGDCILIENKSTNTGENVRFSRAVLEKAGIRNHPASSPFKSPIWNGARWLRSRPSGRKYGGGQLPSFLVQEYLTRELRRVWLFPPWWGTFKGYWNILNRDFPRNSLCLRRRWRHSACWWKRGMAPSCSRVSPFLGILEKTRFLLLLNADCGHQYNPHSQPNYITYHGRQNQHRPRPNGKNREPL